MKEELRRNGPGATPVKRRGNSQASQQAIGDLSALPGKKLIRKLLYVLKTSVVFLWDCRLRSAECLMFTALKILFHRNDLLLPGVRVQRADTEHFHHHSENPEEGHWYQECYPHLRDVPHPAWVTPSTQQPSTGVYQICLPGKKKKRNLLLFFFPQRLFIFPPSLPCLGSFTRRQHCKSGEQAEERPPTSCGCWRVFRGSPVPWPV